MSSDHVPGTADDDGSKMRVLSQQVAEVRRASSGSALDWSHLTRPDRLAEKLTSGSGLAAEGPMHHARTGVANWPEEGGER